MAVVVRIAIQAAIIGLCLGVVSTAAAQQRGGRLATDEPTDDVSYYSPPSDRPEARTIIQQKAQARAAQRQARLASLSWYGMSNSRPTAAPTPFTSIYSPAWQMPGGQPYAWYPADRLPSYLIYLR